MIIQDLDYQESVESEATRIAGGISFSIPPSFFTLLGQAASLIPPQATPIVAPVIQQMTRVLANFGVTFENFPTLL